MNTGPARLNAMPDDVAVAALLRCCGSRRWAGDVARRRPFTDAAALDAAAADAFTRLGPDDWREAFAAHERPGAEPSGVAGASARTKARLTAANDAYVDRFGHAFLMCTTERTAEEMLAELERRLANGPELELGEAAAQQHLITGLRLAELLEP